MKKIAILGGTFDPVHLGHLALAKCARETAALDRVIFMPCWQSPFKGNTVATSEQRFEMLRKAIEEMEFGWAEVSDYEILRPGPSYSWETVEHFQKENEDSEVQWCWILGTDQWRKLEQWAEPGKLRRMLHFIVMTRNGDEVKPRKGWSFEAIPFHHPASSTRIREDFAAHRDWLPESVERIGSQIYGSGTADK